MEFLRLLESIRTPFGNAFFSALTFIGSQALIIVVFSLYYWCIDKKFARSVGAAFFLSSLFVHGIKIICRVPRPFIADKSLTPVEAALSGATGYSFPSGHSQTVTSVMLPLGYEYRKKKWVPAVCAATALLTIFSRMYLGVHTPADVAAGALLGAVCSAVMICSRGHSGDGRVNVIAAVLAAGSLFSIICAAVINSRCTVEYQNIADVFKNAGACMAYAAGTFLENKYLDFKPAGKTAKGKAVTVLLGLAGALLLLEAPKLLYSGILVLDAARYFLAIFWIVFIYPAILKKYEKKSFAA